MSTRRRMKAGQAYPIYVIMYSSARFCYEFFRNNDPVLGPLQTYHLLCIAGVVIGVVELLIVNKFGDSINDFFERNSFENKLKNKDRKGRVKK